MSLPNFQDDKQNTLFFFFFPLLIFQDTI